MRLSPLRQPQVLQVNRRRDGGDDDDGGDDGGDEDESLGPLRLRRPLYAVAAAAPRSYSRSDPW
jgi:hypothetical protein